MKEEKLEGMLGNEGENKEVGKGKIKQSLEKRRQEKELKRYRKHLMRKR